MRTVFYLCWLGLLFGSISCVNHLLPGETKEIREQPFLAVDFREVTVEAWLSFYSWKLKFEGEKVARQFLPDSQAVPAPIWKLVKTRTQEMQERLSGQTLEPIGFFPLNCQDLAIPDSNVHRMELSMGQCPYYSFPITGVGYEQVMEFCRWRSTMFETDKLVFRLPTETEWKMLALKGLPNEKQAQGMPDSVNGKQCANFLYTFRQICANRKFNDGYLTKPGLWRTAHFHADKSGCFDFFGNVSEMVQEKGKAKGGNFQLPARACHADSTQFFSKGEIWLGFRCVVVRQP